MPDLIFGTRGQAEALAAQEAIAAKARAIRAEFAGGSSALKQWEDPVKRVGEAVNKSFDPARIGKWVGSFIGVGAAINQLRMELEDVQAQIDKVAERQKKGYEEALKAGDTERAERLKARVESIGAFEAGSQQLAEIQTTEYFGAEELKTFDEVLASLGQGYTERTLKSWGRRAAGGGGVRREDAISSVESEMANLEVLVKRGELYEKAMQARGAQVPETAREAFNTARKQLEVLQAMLTKLESLDNKDAGIPVNGE